MIEGDALSGDFSVSMLSPNTGKPLHSKQVTGVPGFKIHPRHTGSWDDGRGADSGSTWFSPRLGGLRMGSGRAQDQSAQSLQGYLSLKVNKIAVGRKGRMADCTSVTCGS